MTSPPRTIEQRWVDLVRREPRRFSDRLAVLALRGLSVPYVAALKANLWLYRVHVIKRQPMPLPVVSVGNLTLGGTGKSSFCAAIAKHIRDAGVPTAILLRGYRRDSHEPMLVVSDCQGEVHAGYSQAGDEALMLARELPGVAVLVGRDRLATGRAAYEQLGARALVLDDGLSYFRMERDLEIALVDATQPQDLAGVFPAGMLREPLSHLRRAHVVCLTHASLASPDELESVAARVRQHTLSPLLQACHRPIYIRRLAGAEREPPTTIGGQRVLCLSGIGNPRSFHRTVQQLGAEVAGTWQLPDHGQLSPQEFQAVCRAAEQAQADEIVTTEKDAVRLETIPGAGRLLVLGIRLHVTSGAAELWRRIDNLISSV